MSLQKFLQQKGMQTTQAQPFQSGSLSSFLQQKTGITQPIKPPEIKTTTPIIKPEKEEKKSKIKGVFSWLGKQLMKPVGITAKEISGVGETIGSLVSIASPRIDAKTGVKIAAKRFLIAQKGAGRVLLGKEKTDFMKEIIEPYQETMKSIGVEPNKFDKAVGISANFIIDPSWLIAPAKVVKGVGKITKLEKPAKVVSEAVRKTPAVKKLRTLFTTATGNKEFDNVVKKFRNLKEAREETLIEDAVKLQKDIKGFKKTGIKNVEELITEGLENPASLGKITDKKIIDIVDNLKNTYSGLLKKAKNVNLKIGEIVDYAPHIRTKESFIGKIQKEFGLGAREWGKGAVEKGRKLEGTIKELTETGIDIFEKNPAIQLVKKGQMYAKAITSQEFAETVKQFAIKKGDDVIHPALKGLKFDKEVASVIDNFYQGIKPKELKVIIKGFDKVQNWWKAQALISPSYHIRNIAGNLWNNFIAGINPIYYKKAIQLQKNPLIDEKVIKDMKELGVINQGWYAKDIGEEVLQRVEGIGAWKGLNPLRQENKLFQLNRNVGSSVENNARMAHYLSKIADGLNPEKAAESVKKFLFDYGDLTTFEKTIMKRFAPFYTWTRKNLPIQLEGIITQPAKFVLPHKVIEVIESGVEVPNEKFMSSYITENVPVRIRKNKDGNTEYFLLGNWLPYASAIDVLSHPIDTVVQMATPFLKTPIEQWANKSSFWENTLGEYQDIERRFKQQSEFLGMSMRKKNIQLLRNIRILNDVNKWIDKQDPTAVENSYWVKALITLFGKTATYDVGKSKYFYDLDTEDRIYELEKAIKDARKRGFDKKAAELRMELVEFKQERQEGF